MNDITERLRAPRCGLPMSATAADRDMYNVATREEAADKIDRLRAELAEANRRLADVVHAYEGQAAELAEAKAQRVPDGYVLVPKEPTAAMIEEGAKSIASWEFTSIWPDSWGAMADQLREDARTAYVSMVSESPFGKDIACAWHLTKDKDWQPSCTEEWARFKYIPPSQACPSCGLPIEASLSAAMGVE